MIENHAQHGAYLFKYGVFGPHFLDKVVGGWLLNFTTTGSVDILIEFLDWTWLCLFNRAPSSSCQHHVEVPNVAWGFGFCCGVGEGEGGG